MAAIDLNSDLGEGISAHPSYPDREGFGRRDVTIDPAELRDEILRQLEALTAISTPAGTRVRYLKVSSVESAGSAEPDAG